MDLFTYLMAKKGRNSLVHGDLFSYLLGNKGGTSGTYTTFTGTLFNINNTLKAKINNIILNPTTSSQEKTTGKNLFSSEFELGILDASGQPISNNNGMRTKNFIKVLPNTTYTMQNNNNYTETIYCYDDNYNFIEIIAGNLGTTTFTTGNNAYYIKTRTAYSRIENDLTTKYQLELGSTATSYEPYTGGIPAPNLDYPFPIHTVSGENNIKIENKNLFNRITATENRIPNWATGVNGSNNNSITSDFTNIFNITKFISSFRFVPFFYDKDKNYLGWGNELKKSAGSGASSKNSWDMPANSEVYYCKFAFLTSGNNNMNMNEQNIMVENNTTAGIYEPHQEQNYSINLDGLEYCKLGTYGDQIFKNTLDSPYYDNTLNVNEWYMIKNIQKHIISDNDISTISTYWYDNTGQYGAGISKEKLGLPRTTSDRRSLCTVSSKINSSANIAENTYIFNANSIYVYFFNSGFDTIENANAKLVGASVYYNLSEPVYINITQDYPSLAQQLENLNNNARSYNEQTNISQTNNDLPFDMSIDVKIANVGFGLGLNNAQNIIPQTNISNEEQENQIIDDEENIEEEVG